MKRKIIAGIVGLAIGIITMPMVAVVWPLFIAYFAFNETDGDGYNIARKE